MNLQIKININTILTLIVASIFVFGYTIRVSFVSSLQYVSVFFILGVVAYLYLYNRYISITKLLLFFVYFIITISSDLLNNVSVQQWMLYFLMNTFSLLFLVLKEDKIVVNQNTIKRIIKVYNVFIFVIFGIYLIDLLTGSMIMGIVSDKFIPSISSWVPRGESLFRNRYASYLGHYLYTNLVYIAFYIINAMYIKYFDESIIKNKTLCLLSSIGVLSTGSKTGLVMLLILLIVFNGKSMKSILVLTIGTVTLYGLGFFNIILERLQTESFSTGRVEAWQLLLKMNILEINWFHGIGDNFFGYLNRFLDFGTSAVVMEFPVFCIFYKVGIVGFLCYIGLLVLAPILMLRKYKSFYGMSSIFIFFFILGTYNGLISYPDAQIIHEFIIVMCIWIVTSSQRLKNSSRESIVLNKE